MTQKPDKLGREKESEFSEIVSRMSAEFLFEKADWNKRVAPYLREFQKLLSRQKSETIEEIKENLKHIAMFDNGKRFSLPKYLVKDVLDLLDKLNN